jgi:hypothetical protein
MKPKYQGMDIDQIKQHLLNKKAEKKREIKSKARSILI